MGGLNGRGSGLTPLNSSFEGGLSGTYPTRLELAGALIVTYTPSDLFASKDKMKVEEYNEEAAKQEYDAQLQQLIGKLGESRASYDSAMAMARYTPYQLSSAKATLEQSLARYKAGLNTIVEVADAQRLVYESEVEDKLARVGVWSSLLMISKAQGSLGPFLRLVKARRGQ